MGSNAIIKETALSRISKEHGRNGLNGRYGRNIILVHFVHIVHSVHSVHRHNSLHLNSFSFKILLIFYPIINDARIKEIFC